MARGRIRRWARWQITGAAAAAQAASTVTTGLGNGHVPQPWGAILVDVVDVVDQRPAYRPGPVA